MYKDFNNNFLITLKEMDCFTTPDPLSLGIYVWVWAEAKRINGKNLVGNRLLAISWDERHVSNSAPDIQEHGKRVSGHGTDRYICTPRQGPTSQHSIESKVLCNVFPCYSGRYETLFSHNVQLAKHGQTHNLQIDWWPVEMTSIYDEGICECQNSCIWKYTEIWVFGFSV